MIRFRMMPLVIRQVTRHRTRTLLTAGGVATSMFLFVAVQAMQNGVAMATETSAADTTLVVYREDRYCPFTSRLPQYYLRDILTIQGVESAVPMKVVVSNCRASLDVVTFRGVPSEEFSGDYAARMTLIDGDLQQWRRRSDAALVGETLAARRGLKIGDRFDAAGVITYVAAIISSHEPQDQNVAYVHLDFLQQTTDRKLGTVTQFNIKVQSPKYLDSVARAVDERFASAEYPTSTRPEKAFVAQAAADMIELIGFTRWLGWGCLAAVLALVGNAIVLGVQDRIREHAVLQTLGYNSFLIQRLIVTESLLLGLLGGVLGAGLAVGVLQWGQFALTADGVSIPFAAGWTLILFGVGLSVLLGVVAGLVPAWQAARRPITTCFRAV
ncbi:FtsX-like permease family protein [Planctomycetales bacterium ZRK34]|nr:FtsX-like permease family protein [Planctomycetales bacterium ZRK34]